MATDSFYTLLGNCIKAFYDTSGNRYEAIQGGFLDNAKEYTEQIELLSSIIRLCIETDKYFTPAVKQYFLQYELSQTRFAQKMKISFNTFHSQMQRGKDRLVRDFGEEFIIDLSGRRYGKGKALDPVRLNNYIFKYNRVAGLESELYSILDLDLSSKRAGFNSKGIDEEDWDEWFEKINLYTPRVRDTVSKLIPKEFIGYVNYLLCSVERRNDKEEQRYKQLMELIAVNKKYLNK